MSGCECKPGAKRKRDSAQPQGRAQPSSKGGDAMKICMVGQGAFARKHLDGLARIKDAEVVTIYGRTAETTEAAAKKYGIPHWTTNMDEALARPGVEAAILTSPTQVHAEQAIKVMRAGKHVQIEIPIADTLADAERILAVQKETGLTAMGGHTRRFNPSHQWIHKKIKAGELKLQHLVVQTFFFRRTNMNADGKAQPIDVSKVDVSMDGIELQDREFIAAIQQKREPNSSVDQVLPAMRSLDRLEKSLK